MGIVLSFLKAIHSNRIKGIGQMSIIEHQAKQRSKTPFRHDIVGSFLRPEALKAARRKFQNGEITTEQLKKVEDEEIVKLVAKQKEVGLKAVTDGEFRRSWWHLDFMWGLDGVEKAEVEKGYHSKVRKQERKLRV